MAFFEVMTEKRLTPEARESFQTLKRRKQTDHLDRIYHVLAAHPKLLGAFVQALEGFTPIPSRLGSSQFIAGMLIAHSRHCRACFEATRDTLFKLGLDDSTLDGMCAAPEALPLTERERKVVEFTLRVARSPEALKLDDFSGMARAGFTKDEILEMIGVAAYWNMAVTLSTAVDAGLREE